MNQYIGIIPFRKDSKRLPNKNILEICGLPLYQHTEQAAINSVNLDRIIIATDYGNTIKPMDKSVIKYQRKPVSDSQQTIDLLVEMVQYYNFILDDYIVLLQPTCPLRTTKHIDEAIDKHRENPTMNLVSAYAIDNQVYNDDGIHLDALRLPVYQRNSAIYITRIEDILAYRTLFYDLMSIYEMPKSLSLDINTRSDFIEVAQVMEGVKPNVNIYNFAKRCNT
jgi:CMP-N,N'-diacetyllegionaminic acid synthase